MNFFCDILPKNWGNGPKLDQKYDFVKLKKNLVNNFY